MHHRPIFRIQCSSALWFVTHLFFFLFFFFFIWLHRVACGILVPRPGIEPVPPAVEERSVNHWTPREAPVTHHWPCFCLPFPTPWLWLHKNGYYPALVDTPILLMQTDHQLVFVALSHTSLGCNISAKQENILFQCINTNSIFKINTSQADLNNKLTSGSAMAQTDILIKCDDGLSRVVVWNALWLLLFPYYDWS